ncbi:MAG: MFS transporter [Actinomycetia bacterium]|nr:MFS transporter [Actinomycetes bacterium]MCP3909589.1 MFS transporter [Actinomycetes bacterium]MCP4087754.1 MFS transporter [Actinomycetes bacterium]
MRAFRHRDFRIFFLGALASNTGNWLQNLAVPYVLFELTGKSIWVGLAGFAQFLPAFLLGPVGGSLADTKDRRTVLLVSQTAMAGAAMALWAVWAIGWHRPGLILAITALTGIVSGFMVPSWQAFVPSLVPRQDLASAVTLNSTQFNASRAFGPALAGVILALSGPGLAFLLNGLSFIAVIGALWVVRPTTTDRRAPATHGVLDGFHDAISYIKRRTGILVGVLSAMLVAFFGNPVTQFTVVFAEEVYEAGPRVLGVLAAAVGVGAVLAAPVLSTWDTRVTRAATVRYALPGYALAVIAFGLAPNWPLGLAALLLVGACFLAVIATTNTAVQLIVADEMRGRVMSARVMGFTLSFPLGSLAQGALADVWGPQATVVAFGGCLLAAALYLASRPTLLAHLDAEDDRATRVV